MANTLVANLKPRDRDWAVMTGPSPPQSKLWPHVLCSRVGWHWRSNIDAAPQGVRLHRATLAGLPFEHETFVTMLAVDIDPCIFLDNRERVWLTVYRSQPPYIVDFSSGDQGNTTTSYLPVSFDPGAYPVARLDPHRRRVIRAACQDGRLVGRIEYPGSSISAPYYFRDQYGNPLAVAEEPFDVTYAQDGTSDLLGLFRSGTAGWYLWRSPDDGATWEQKFGVFSSVKYPILRPKPDWGTFYGAVTSAASDTQFGNIMGTLQDSARGGLSTPYFFLNGDTGETIRVADDVFDVAWAYDGSGRWVGAFHLFGQRFVTDWQSWNLVDWFLIPQ